jgi:uncharacterized protein (TIGR02271 family)
MITQDQVRDLEGATAYDPSGEKIGKVGAVYYDDQTDEPKWVTVNTGLFGTNQTFVPVHDAEISGDRVTLAYDKAKVKDAPNVSEEGHLSPQEEQQLYGYYGIGYGGRRAEGFVGGDVHGDADAGRTARDAGEGQRQGEELAVGRRERGDRDGGVYDDVEDRGVVGRDTSGPTTDDAMTRSEEQLRVGTETQEAGRARLRKRVVTEHQQMTVPVSHEEITLDREPIAEGNRGDAYSGPEISEEEHEVTLHAERPVVDTEAVAVERVRLGKETVTEQQTVGGEVRKEQVDLDRGDTAVGEGRRDDAREEQRDRN